MSDDLKKLRIEDCLNFCNCFLDRANTASKEDLIQALYVMGFCLVKATCQPGTDEETMRVLGIYQADEMLSRTEENLTDLVTAAEKDFDTPVDDDPVIPN